LVDSGDEDEESDGGVSSFEATPAFKKAQPQQKVPKMITRSQKKTTVVRSRKRTAKQADLDSEAQTVAGLASEDLNVA